MQTLTNAAIVMCGFAAVVFWLQKQGYITAANRRRNVRYLPKSLMTNREREFYHRLRAALPDVHVHPQVAMSALIAVSGEHRSARNRFDRKCLDFVVCSPENEVLYVAELDDRSHAMASARKRDAVKDEILRAAGFRIIRYSSVKTDAETLKRDFMLMQQMRDRDTLNDSGVGMA